MTVGRRPQAGQGVGQPDFVWLRGLAGGNNRFFQSVTAFAGGGQANGTPIGATQNNADQSEAQLVEIQVVATIADSCQLPAAVAGKVLDVFNSTANSANVFASPSINKATGALDTINALTNVTAYAIAAGVSVRFFSPRNGIWAALKSV